MTDKTKRKQSIKKKVPKPEHIDPCVMCKIAEDLKSYDQMMDPDEMRKTKDKFMDLYQKCEFAYKQMLIDYKIKVDGLECIPGCKPKKGEKTFNPDKLNIYDTQVEKVLPYAKIAVDLRLFCNDDEHKAVGKKSCRALRNEITHSSSKKAVKEVFDRQTELFPVMKAFLDCFKKYEK